MQGQIEYQKNSENSENLTFEISFFYSLSMFRFNLRWKHKILVKNLVFAGWVSTNARWDWHESILTIFSHQSDCPLFDFLRNLSLRTKRCRYKCRLRNNCWIERRILSDRSTMCTYNQLSEICCVWWQVFCGKEMIDQSSSQNMQQIIEINFYV